MDALITIISTALLCRSHRRMLYGNSDLLNVPGRGDLGVVVAEARWKVHDAALAAVEAIGITEPLAYASIGYRADDALPG